MRVHDTEARVRGATLHETVRHMAWISPSTLVAPAAGEDPEAVWASSAVDRNRRL